MSSLSRYNKQLILSEFGEINQLKIKDAKVLVIGIGGIGCPVLIYLSSMGFEKIGIIDDDIVELSNLHRQIIYKESDIGLLKIDCAVDYCVERNSNVDIQKYPIKLTNKNALEIFEHYDAIIDCTDNIFTRYTANDACVILEKPYIFGSAIETAGQIGVFNYNGSPCLRCIYPQTTMLTCESTGVLGVVPGIIGNLLALEVVKFICDFDGLLVNKLMNFDMIHGFNTINITEKNPNCLICNRHKFITRDNYSMLDIYEPKCVMKNNYGLQRSEIEMSREIIYINAGDSIDELYEKYSNLNNSSTEMLIFDCENKIRSKILVNKLRQNGVNNAWVIQE